LYRATSTKRAKRAKNRAMWPPHAAHRQAMPQQAEVGEDEFRRHQQEVLAGRFRAEEATGGGEAKRPPSIVLEAGVRAEMLTRLVPRASQHLRELERALQENEAEVEAATRSRAATVRSLICLGLCPNEDESDEAIAAALEAYGEESRQRVGQGLVEKRRRFERVTAADVAAYVRARLEFAIGRAAALTDRQVAGLDFALSATQRVETAIDRRLVEARFLDHCVAEDDGAPPRKTQPCCVWVQTRTSFLRRLKRSSPPTRDAVAIPCSPLTPWGLYQGLEAEYDVTFFPCRVETPFHGIHFAVLACDWSLEASRRDGHPKYYLAKFITDPFLRVAARANPAWHEPLVELAHVHKPLLTPSYQKLAQRIQDPKTLHTWTTDMHKLLHLTFPAAVAPPAAVVQAPPHQPPHQHQRRPHRQQHQPPPPPPPQQQQASPPPQTPRGPAVPVPAQALRIRQDHQDPDLAAEPHRHSIDNSGTHQATRMKGFKRLRSLSQGPPELDNDDLDFDFDVHPHRLSA